MKGLSLGTKLNLFVGDDSFLYIYRTIKSSTDSAILQKDLDLLQLWEHIIQMEDGISPQQMPVTSKLSLTKLKSSEMIRLHGHSTVGYMVS